MLSAVLLATTLAALPAHALHISEATHMPNILTVPELLVPRPGLRRLSQLNEGDRHGLHHSFMGTTDVGFVEFNYSAVPKTTSIHAADYDSVLSSATITCTPVVAGAAPTLTPQGVHVRNDVTVTIEFTSAAMALLDSAHLAERTQAEGAYLTIDHSLHASHPSFGPGSACSAQIPFEASVYAVASAALQGAVLTLTLTPASARDAHHVLDVKFFWDPDTEREVGRRRSLGLATGADARRRLRGRAMPATPITGSTTLGMNYDGNGGATAASIEILASQAGAVTCTNCYAFVKATYSVNFQFCTGLYELTSGSTWLFTSEKADGSMGTSGWGATTSAPAWTATSTTDNLADCTAALAPWIAVSAGTATSGGPATINLGGSALTTNINGAAFTASNALRAGSRVFNSAFNIDASVGGTAGFNFLLSSKGITAAGSTPSCSGTDSSQCFANAVQIATVATPFAITIATGITATVSANVKGAATWTGALPWTLSVGASAAVGTTASPVKLGGRIMIGDMVALANSCSATSSSAASACITALGSSPNLLTSYTNFPLTYSATPLSVTLTANPAASLDATIWTTTTIIVDAAIPISVSSAIQLQSALAKGTSSRRSLGYAETARMLDSAATCPSTGSYLTVTSNALLGATAGPTTLQQIITGMGSQFNVPTGAVAIMPTLQILPTMTITAQAANPNGASQPLVAACMALNTPLTGSAGGAGSTPVTAAGGGGGAAAGTAGTAGSGGGGGSASGSSSNAVALGLGLGLGLFLPLLIAGGLAYHYDLLKLVRGAMERRAAAAALTKEPVPVAAGRPAVPV